MIPFIRDSGEIVTSTYTIIRAILRSVHVHHFQGGPVPRLDSWNIALYSLLVVMRSFVVNHARDLSTLRTLTDFPIIPKLPLRSRSCHIHIQSIHTEIVWPANMGNKNPLIEPSSKLRVVIYLHGGGGALCSSRTHQIITHMMAVRSNTVVVVPNYRRVPEVSLLHSIEDGIAVYIEIVQAVDASQVALCGDSAGGTLVVNTLCRLRNDGIALPRCAVLFSPWCDITRVPSLPSRVDYLTQDVIGFMIELLTETTMDLSSLNPMEMDLRGLPPMLIQFGDSELFEDQIRAFTKRCETNDLKVTLKEYHEMVHIPHFFCFLSAEGDRAMTDAALFLVHNLF